MQPHHHPGLPLIVKLTLKKSKINIFKENIEGVLKLTHINEETHRMVHGFSIELVQQEIQVSTAARNGSDKSKDEIYPFELRTLVKYEIADGCPVEDDKIPFSIPLRGMELGVTPTLRNVLNKFSVKYFIKLCIQETDPSDTNKTIDVWSKPFEIVFYK